MGILNVVFWLLSRINNQLFTIIITKIPLKGTENKKQMSNFVVRN